MNNDSDNDGIQFGDFDADHPSTPPAKRAGASEGKPPPPDDVGLDMDTSYMELLNEADLPRAPIEGSQRRIDPLPASNPSSRHDYSDIFPPDQDQDVETEVPISTAPPVPPPLAAEPRKPAAAPVPEPPPKAAPSRNEMLPKIGAVVGLVVIAGVVGYQFLGGSSTDQAAPTSLGDFGQFAPVAPTDPDADDFYANLPRSEDVSEGDSQFDPAESDPMGDVGLMANGLAQPFDAKEDPQSTDVRFETQQAQPGVASAAFSSVVAQAESMLASLEKRLVSRIEAIEKRVQGREAGDRDLASKVAALEAQVQKMSIAGSRAAAPRAQAVPTQVPSTIFDSYTITSPNGVLTQAQLFFGDTKKPDVGAIRMQTGKAETGNYYVMIEVPDSRIDVLPPKAEGVVTRARTTLHPNHRRFAYFAPVPIEGHVVVTDTAVDVLMAPVGNREFAMAQARRDGNPEAAAIIESRPVQVARAQPPPTAGVRLGPDGRVVAVEEMGSRTVAGNQRVTGGSGPYAPTTLGASQGMDRNRPVAVVPPFYGTPNTPAVDTRVVTTWAISAMTGRLAILVNLQTGARLSVMVDTYIDGVGRVTQIDTVGRRVMTESGVISAA